ncbi:MAG TPA: MFS transporter [Dehalococcoidia bacterium]|nr:MFS transporter [Dehalococcoidia bacterium]
MVNLQVLKKPRYVTLVGSNTLASIGSVIQVLLHGWLILAWGHNPLYLLFFAAARVLPKVVLTLPAGIVCDRLPKRRVLALTRCLNSVASLIPLATFFFPAPIAWLLIGSTLAGVAFAFEVPGSRSAIGDTAETQDIYSVVALNNGGSHLAAIVGPLTAVFLGPLGLLVSAGFFAASSIMTLFLPSTIVASAEVSASSGAESTQPGGAREMLRYVMTAPVIGMLVVLAMAPPTIDRGISLMVPSLAAGSSTISVALLAPELGALFASLSLTIVPIRLSVAATVGTLPGYGLLVGLALNFSHSPVLLIGGLLLAGVLRLAFMTNSQAWIQEKIPPRMRGRILAF